MDYITKKINIIDNIIRKNENISQIEKDTILQDLQLIHFTIKNIIENKKDL